MNEVKIDIDSIKERLGDLEMQLIMKDTQIMELQTKNNELETQNAELKAKINELETQNAELKAKINELENAKK